MTSEELSKEELENLKEFRQGFALRKVMQDIGNHIIDTMITPEKYTDKKGVEQTSHKVNMELLAKALNVGKCEYPFKSHWRGYLFIEK